MEYKSTYSAEEVKELYQWFDEHEYENSIELGYGIKVMDIKMLLDRSHSIAVKKHNNPTYSGQINFLFQVQQALIEQGKVKK